MGLNVGCRTVEAAGPDGHGTFPVKFLYPTMAAGQSERFGPYALDVAMEATVEGGDLLLAAISHGHGGTALVYRGLALHLARAGFVVAMPDHPGNNRNDNSLAGTSLNLENRPRHIRAVLDAAFADPVLGRHLLPGVVGLIGHSLGGYTALAAAGGRPTAFAHETANGEACPVPVVPDGRVKALVLLAPATVWFMADGALADVSTPILMLTAEHDAHTPEIHARIARGVPASTRIEHRVVAGAGHFAFLDPFPPALCRPDFPPSQDPPGFDRPAFLEGMNAEIAAFLKEALSPAG